MRRPPDTHPAAAVATACCLTSALCSGHLGFYNWESTPTFRGFDSFYGFYEGSEDYFKHTTSEFDFHREPSPRCGPGCSQLPWGDIGTYSAMLFSDEAQTIIKANRASANKDPLFIYLAYQSVHAPAQAPQSYIDLFSTSLPGDEFKQRRTFAGMVHCMDEGLGNVTALLKTEGMWTKEEPTIIVFTDENGAPTDACAQIGGSNLPRESLSDLLRCACNVCLLPPPPLTHTHPHPPTQTPFRVKMHCIDKRVAHPFCLINVGCATHRPWWQMLNI